MKYLTKDWYALCEKTFLSELLEDDKRAAVKDEDYFKEVLDLRIGEAIALEDEIAKMSGEDVEIDIAEFEDTFIKSLNENVALLKKVIPPEICSEIADLRVFALNKATAEVHKKLRIYCDNAQKTVDEKLKEYEDYYDNADIPEEIDRKLGFHDAMIVSADFNGSDFELKFDISQSFADQDRMTLIDAVIVEREGDFTGSVWLYDEIYKTDKGYELHVLACDSDFKPLYFTFECSDIKF